MPELFAEDFEKCCAGDVEHVREWRQPVMNGEPAGQRVITKAWYACRGCGRELKPKHSPTHSDPKL